MTHARLMRDAAFIELLNAALDTWDGTPEELGETLQTASTRFQPLGVETYDRQRRADIQQARRRMRQTPEGRRLLDHELEGA